MTVSVGIDKNDLGFTAEKLKSLLSKLAELNNRAKSLSKEDELEIHLNFGPDDAHDLSLAVIWRILGYHQSLPCNKKIVYQKKSQNYFDERHFFDSLTGRKSSLFGSSVPINFETFAPIRPKKGDDQNQRINDIFTNVTKNILDNGNSFHKELKVQMVETVQNAFDHSESGPLSAGIVCSLRKSGIIDFCVVDMGQGIKKSFLSNSLLREKILPLQEVEIIKHATGKGISCNPYKARNPVYTYPNGGIGLYYLREFVRLHPESRLVIVSGRGYYYTEYQSPAEKLFTLPSPWSGTLIYFRTQINQEKKLSYTQLADQVVTEFDNRSMVL